MQHNNLTVVILTKNEAYNIRDCIDSVSDWADETIVVDDFSTDETVQTAESLGAKIIIKRMDNEGKHRNWAYAQAKNTWVLSLDADEKVTEELKQEITEATGDTQCVAYSIPLRNYIGSFWVRHGGWYPAAKVRLFRKDKFKYEEVVVHPRAFIDGECGHLKSDIIHKGYPDFEHFLASLNRQTTLEAQKWITTKVKMSRARIVRRTIDRFLRRYIRKKGFKDGFIGFMIAFFDSLYQIMSYAKFWQLRQEAKKD